MADPVIAAVSVDTTVGGTEILPPGPYRFVAIKVLTANVFMDFVRKSGTTLTTANGVEVATTDPVVYFQDKSPASLFKNGIKGITASGTASVRIQAY